MRSKGTFVRASCLSTIALTAAVGCGESDTGAGGSATLQVLLEPEDTVIDGLTPGMGDEQIRDGWKVRFDKYLITTGKIEVQLATDKGVSAEAPELFVTDLVQLPQGGAPLWELPDLSAGRYEFYYSLAPAGTDAKRHESVSAEDFEQMKRQGVTYWIKGNLSKDDGQSCPPKGLASPGATTPNGRANARQDDCFDNPLIEFEFAVEVSTDVGPCEIDEASGFSIPAGGTQTVAISIHGDHIFFNGFPGADESAITRLAQWLADCDLDLDGTVSQEELAAVAPSDLAEIDERFALGGSPVTPLRTMEDYVRAQLQTQAHFQGEGECPVRR